MGSAGTVGEATVTPIYWAPSGYSFTPSYVSTINTYVSNVAADSGKTTNVFATTAQYTNGVKHMKYEVHAGSALTDTNPFPTTQTCAPDSGAIYQDTSGYTACIDDLSLQSEVQVYLSAHHLPSDLAHMYLVFLPKGAESCFTTSNGSQGGQCTINDFSSTAGGFCGYHSFSGVYASMPFPVYGSATGYTCSPEFGPGNQAPNGDLDADVEISVTSHEMAESFTDPYGSAWYDNTGNEIGDDCGYVYGSGFGGSPGAMYNQTINGAHYFTQEEFSNEDFNVNNANSCIQQEEPPTAVFTVTTANPTAGIPVSFNGAPSNDPDLAHGIVSYSWNFGDSSPAGTSVTPTHTYISGGTYTVALTVTDKDGWQATASYPVQVMHASGSFTGVSPRRVLDTRTGLGAPRSKLGAGATLTLSIPGLPAGTTAVAMNVTAVNGTAFSFLTLYPGGSPRPNASNLNFAPGQAVANMVQVPLGPGHTITFYNSAGAVDVLADVLGYYLPTAGAGFIGQSPVRVLDTRVGLGAPRARLGAHATLTLSIPGLPAGTTAVAMNVTAVNGTAVSFLTLYPGGSPRPNTSNLNFAPGQAVANMVQVPLGPGHTVTVYNSAGAVDVLADVLGYFRPATGAQFNALTPIRALDTRIGLGAPRARLGADSILTLTLSGLPAGTTAVAMNVTAVNGTAVSFLTLYPGGSPRPNASNLNFAPGQAVANMVQVPLGPGNTITVYNSAGTVDVLADVLGYYQTTLVVASPRPKQHGQPRGR